MDEAQLDRVGCFNTKRRRCAQRHLPTDPAEVKQRRWDRFMEKAQVISEVRKLAAKSAPVMDVIIATSTRQRRDGRRKSDARDRRKPVYR
jgi:ribosomal protein S12 methylthiotransferase